MQYDRVTVAMFATCMRPLWLVDGTWELKTASMDIQVLPCALGIAVAQQFCIGNRKEDDHIVDQTKRKTLS
jgi:hypothetical protein